MSEVSKTTKNPDIGNVLLAEVLSEYHFEQYENMSNMWTRLIDNDSNCQCKVFLHLLRGDEVVRVSVSNQETEHIDATDLFETKDMDKVRRLLELVMF